MTTTEPQPLHTHTPGASAAVDMLRSEMSRADSKASLLLALTGAALAGIGSAAPQLKLPVAAIATGALGVCALLTALIGG
ncbi:hypothetical protein [Streptomyces acidiscabies]|uniref:hypothetical protein n=1 Tax=Streptomyces acidiscabies TaxID=42234 RepID=UPI0038F7F836